VLQEICILFSLPLYPRPQAKQQAYYLFKSHNYPLVTDRYTRPINSSTNHLTPLCYTSFRPITQRSQFTRLTHYASATKLYFPSSLQRVSIACYAERCISYDRFCLTDRLTV